MTSWDEVMATLKALGGGIIAIVILYGGMWIKKVFDQRKKNEIKEIDLTNTKIKLDNSAKPIDQLVDESNKSHGAQMVEPSGDDDKKGSKGGG